MIGSILLALLFCGCSSKDDLRDINGYWEGTNTNDTTNKSWSFTLYLEQRGKRVEGIYTDYHGSFGIRNATYDGDSVGFIIDLYPDIVSYFGDLTGRNSMAGTWSYSLDGTNGSWTLVRDIPDF
jgi:hypothetical protein